MANQDAPAKAAAAIPTADDLRMEVLEKQMKEIDRRVEAKKAEQKRLEEAAAEFLATHVTEREREIIRRIVANAVNDGKYEAMVYSFPAKLCTDGGRAINNIEPDWPTTLQGKARELYDGFKANLQPRGYRLKAMIIDFPGGMPGNVGFFLNWEPKTF
ncbi:histidine kinase [Acuticoccus sediminis]|uniref:Histidine kinase n=1 Tax=Acuticoccus sediminis TaxID=2184697 RepID=A0A8B2NUB8_9HYPH|nr:histidine kinase [Acuticoccus sediminis]RAI03788.1 histidine kinase [Acuticoccus sediminis]